MRTPEEVAREWESCVREEHEDGPACSQHDMPWPCEDQAVLNIADLIRARDAEVRAEVDRIALTLSTMTVQGGVEVERIAEVAATLVGLKWETRSRDDGYAGWTTGQGLVSNPPTRERRLVGPWEPVEP